MLFKTVHESIVQDFIKDLKEDNIFVELAKNNKDVKGFKWNDNGLCVLKQKQFTLYVIYDTKINKQVYSIRYDLFKHKNLESLPELYLIAQEKLKTPDYKDKIDQRANKMKKEAEKAFEKDPHNPYPWMGAVLGR